MRSDWEKLRTSGTPSMPATLRPPVAQVNTVGLTYETRRNESRFVIRSRMRQTRADEPRSPCRTGDRDALLGIRELGHALPRVSVARRGPHRLGADRRRGARAPPHRLLSERGPPHPVGSRYGAPSLRIHSPCASRT